MKIKDRVGLARTKSNQRSSFWKRKKIDYNSVGTVMSISSRVAEDTFVSVQWDNSAISICVEKHLKTYEDTDIPLPNVKFRRKQV